MKRLTVMDLKFKISEIDLMIRAIEEGISDLRDDELMQCIDKINTLEFGREKLKRKLEKLDE